MKTTYFYIPTFIVMAMTVAVLLTTKVFAYDQPQFPTCINPQGLVIASYDDGVHGIIGDYGVHSGKDTVYQVSDTTVMQCFCDAQDNGIQTNWWKVTDMSQDQIQSLQDQGWFLTPNGADWGLDEGPYLAKNTSFDCKECAASPSATPTIELTPTGEVSPSSTPSLVPSLTPTPEAGSSGTINQSSSSTGSVQATSSTAPQILAASTHVDTLANTGDSTPLLFSLTAGILSMIGGLTLKRKSL